MDNSYLKEYRCECGKLLFKGYLAVAVIEIKCKRCGKFNSFEEASPQGIPASFTLEVNAGDSIKGDDPSE